MSSDKPSHAPFSCEIYSCQCEPRGSWSTLADCGSRIPPTRGIQVPFGKARLSFSDHSRPLSSRVDLDCS